LFCDVKLEYDSGKKWESRLFFFSVYKSSELITINPTSQLTGYEQLS
jgi:hypothetical protein